MDEQFNGRTDDDLFSDDFEPTPQQVSAAAPKISAPKPAPEPSPPTEAPSPPQAAQPSKPPSSTAPLPKSLAQSRHARPAPNNNRPPKPPASTSNSTSTTPSSQPATTKPPPTGPAAAAKEPAHATPKAGGDSRLGSGANPRTKLTDTELADKMEKMRILAAEKTRKFEQEKRDESEHAVAYARGMEEARKRRLVDEEKRRKGDEERRRLDEERAKNRERKLQAMGMKEGGWDEGKQERLEEEDRRSFRGANGGVRGARGQGLSGSRYADNNFSDDRGDSFSGERGSRGRGRGRGGRGRGGRGGYGDGPADRNGSPATGPGRSAPAHQQAVPKSEDFPALPFSKTPKVDTTIKTPLSPSDFPLSPPIGKWDDEVAAMEAKKNGEA